MSFSCHFQIICAISELQLTLHQVHTVHKVVFLYDVLEKGWTCKFNSEQNDQTNSWPKSPRDKITMIYHISTYSEVPNIQSGRLCSVFSLLRLLSLKSEYSFIRDFRVRCSCTDGWYRFSREHSQSGTVTVEKHQQHVYQKYKL